MPTWHHFSQNNRIDCWCPLWLPPQVIGCSPAETKDAQPAEEEIRVVSQSCMGNTEAGYEFLSAVDGEAALGLYEESDPDLVILDIMMPKLNGYEVCARIRETNKNVPIIFLTAKGDIVDKSVGFGMGADDYLVKPFDPQELKLRADAVLRRKTASVSEGSKRSKVVEIDGIVLDPKARKVSVEGIPVELTPKEFHLLFMLASNPGVVFTKEQIIHDIWGPEYVGESTSAPVLIHRLREKIEKDPTAPKFIQTVWHVGYRFGD